VLALAAGVAVGALVGEDLGSSAASSLLGLSALLVVLALFAGDARWSWRALFAAAIGLGASGAALDREEYGRTPLTRWVGTGQEDGTALELLGRAAADSRLVESRVSVLLDVESASIHGRPLDLRGRARVDVGGSATGLRVVQGERIALFAVLRRPRGTMNPGAADSAVVARRAGLHALGTCKSRLLLRRLSTTSAGSGVSAIARSREWSRRRLEALLPGGEEAILVKAMVLGDRSGMDSSTAAAFRMAGTYHVLAISGAQVAMLGGILLLALARLGAGPAWVALLVSGVLSFYAVFVGADVPVVRATVMFVVFLLGRALDLDADGPNLLGVAGGLLLVARPACVFDVGFQLSFAATLGLLVFAPPLVRALPRWPLRLELGLAASLAAQISLSPLLALHFHRVPLASLLLNLAAVPLSGAVFLSGLGVLLVALVCPPIAPLVADVAWLAGHALLRSAEAAALLPALDLRLPAPSFAAVATYGCGLGLLAGRGAIRTGLGFLGLGAALLAAGPGASLADGRLHLAVLDVGTADCLVLHSPSGRVFAVDAGAPAGALEPGETTLGPYLWGNGTRRVDRLLLTHGHFDHVAAAAFLIRTFRPREVWEGRSRYPAPDARALERSVGTAGASRLCVYRGVATMWDGVELQVLWPEGSSRPMHPGNDESVAIRARIGEVCMLLAGDIGKEVERQIQPPRCQIMKVPHHGSRSSSSQSFLDSVSPRVALVSVGRGRAGFPSAEVVERYARAGVAVFRTDRDGAILISTDGTRTWVRTSREGRERRLP
jgi:competence protein ComEC